MASSYTLRDDPGFALKHVYSVLGTLMTRPSSAAAEAVFDNLSWALAFVDSKRAMSIAKSRSLIVFAGCRRDAIGWVVIPDSLLAVALLIALQECSGHVKAFGDVAINRDNTF